MRSIHNIIFILILSLLRKDLYMYILISILIPTIVSVALYSLPSLNMFRETLYSYDSERPIITVSDEKLFGECYSAKLVEDGVIYVDNKSSSKVPVLIVESDPCKITNKILGRGFCVNYTDLVVMPKDVCISVEKDRRINMTLGSENISCIVSGYWSSNIVLLITSEISKYMINGSKVYLCIETRKDFLERSLSFVENDLIDLARSWVYILILIYIPIIYVTQRRVVESLKTEIKMLYVNGVALKDLKISMFLTLTIVYVATVLYIASLGVMLIYVAWSFLKSIMIIMPPQTRSEVIYMILSMIFSGTATSYIAVKNVVREKEFLE